MPPTPKPRPKGRQPVATNDDPRRDIARRVVVEEGGTQEEAARRSGLSIRTVERWAAREKWRAQRKDRCEYWDSVFKLKQSCLKRATESPTADNVHAWATVESKWPEHRYANQSATPATRREVMVQAMNCLVDVLETAAPELLRELEPHIEAVTAAWERQHGR